MADEQHAPPAPPPTTPSPTLKRLDVLVGTWDMTGRDAVTGAPLTGRLTFEWQTGGFFLIQHIEMDHLGDPITGIEVIGHDHDRDLCTSRYFDSSGNAFQYAWEIDGDQVTTWMGGPGSPAFFKGTLSEDGNGITGAWEWPGGGYSADLTKRAPTA